ncbi:MAG: hypothetical protein JNM09_08730 [Blastocatellia bacterium]|nr:hypothetical protein [Blastocatellia bacterium]
MDEEICGKEGIWMKQDAWWPRTTTAEQPNKNYGGSHQASLLRKLRKRSACHNFAGQTKESETQENQSFARVL